MNSLEMAKKATMRLVVSQEEYDFAKVATFSSQIAFDYVLNTLYSFDVYAKLPRKFIEFGKKTRADPKRIVKRIQK